MNLGSINDQLPTYPNNIQGELRLILQTKDVFLVCYKHLEEYRRLVNEQNRLITKEFVQEQLQIGEDEISELKMELQDAEARLNGRLRHNELLADHLASLGYASLESGASVRHLALCRSPQMRKSMLAQRQGGGGLGCSRLTEPRPPTHMIDNIALAIAEIHQEVRAKVKPLLDYYRDLFYLQLHFSLVLGQVCNYCMPLVTENIGLIDRIFFWSERPEFDLVRRAGDIGDRLKEIYTRAQTVLGVLAESVRFLQSKVELQKTLEQRFHERLDEQQKTKDKILREVHTTKQNMDMLEEENDRLVGSLVKVDPSFVDSRHFYELAEGGNLMGAKKAGNAKETAQNNAEDEGETVNPTSTPNTRRQQIAEESDGVNPKVREAVSPSCLENPTDEVNNNKAISIVGETPVTVANAKSTSKKKLQQDELDALLKDLKEKIAVVKSRAKESPKISNLNNICESSGVVSSVGDTLDSMPTASDTATPTPKSTTRRTRARTRSKSRKREVLHDQSPVRETRSKVRRRATSAERQTKQTNAKKHRPKSTVGTRRIRESEPAPRSKERSSRTPVGTLDESRPSSLSSAAGDNVGQSTVPSGTLKSRLLGRTRDILEAALHRTTKTSTTEPVSGISGDLDTSLAAGQLGNEDLNNDGVTSVSSFASLLVADSSLGEPEFVPPANIIPSRHLRSLEPRKTNKQSNESRKLLKKGRSSRRGREALIDLQQQPLPALSTDTLLIEAPNESKMSPLTHSLNIHEHVPSKTKHYRSRRGKSQMDGNLGDFLTGSGLGPLPSTSSQSSLPSLL
ncbi:hypothetical protein PHET_01639 [Paragonimus heterotremus]|uniref:DUF5743 domain-containing protein n=1 Tax=Paragonimus heterotremus TaxID=100268 RepID=A0A8J4TMC7_9TREM|nr:hypothetical protein PHET_01639 [Paragonimus heterotremus]